MQFHLDNSLFSALDAFINRVNIRETGPLIHPFIKSVGLIDKASIEIILFGWRSVVVRRFVVSKNFESSDAKPD